MNASHEFNDEIKNLRKELEKSRIEHAQEMDRIFAVNQASHSFVSHHLTKKGVCARFLTFLLSPLGLMIEEKRRSKHPFEQEKMI